MSLRFYIGASGAGKSTRIYRDVVRLAKENPETDYLVVVPDQFTMQTQMDLVLASEEKGIMKIDVLSFNRLAHRIADEVGDDPRPVLDDTGKSLVLRRIAAQLRQEAPVIGANLRQTGYIHEVKSSISEFMQYGIGRKELEKLTQFAEGRGALHAKLKDLQTLYEAFLTYIDRSYLTSEGTLDALCGSLRQSALIRNSVLVFDGFTGFTPVQNRVLQELMRLAKDVIVTVTADPAAAPYTPGGEQELFYLSKKTIASLCRLAEEAEVPRGEDVLLSHRPLPRFAGKEALAHLEASLFRYPVRPFPGAQDRVRIFSAGDVQEEVRQACIKIRELVREEGYYYRDIAVIAADMAVYESVLEEEMERYAIPCYLDRTRGLLLNPVVEYLRAALQLLIQDFSYEAVFHYLRSGLAEFTQEEADRLENYVLACGIRGRRQYQKLFVRPARYMEEEKRELQELNDLRERLLEQTEPLLRKTGNTGEFLHHLYAFLERGRVQEKCAQYEQRFRETGDRVRAAEYAQIYRLVIDLMDQMEDLIGGEEMTLQEFAQILDAGFGEMQVGTIPQNVDHVLAGDVERTRLKQVKALFFLGLNDGLIPKNAGRGGLLSDMDREFLAGSGLELSPTPRQQMYIQKLYLYLQMTKPSERLYLSWARMDQEGKALRPSYFLDTVKELFPGLQEEIPEQRSWREQVQSWRDGRRILASGLRRFAEGRTSAPNGAHACAVSAGDGGEALRDEKWFCGLYRAYQENGAYEEWLQQLTARAFETYRHVPLSRAAARALYGDMLLGSVSRLERFAGCAYAHFLQYGLALSEREGSELQALDFGNLYHGSLERFSAKLEEAGYSWLTFPREEGKRLMERAVEETAVESGLSFFQNARNVHLLEGARRLLVRSADTLQFQLKKGRFLPSRFEVGFTRIEELSSVSVALTEAEKMKLTGKIDRVDLYDDGERVYVKVMDYKSGVHRFDLAALYHGLQLQLVIYMNAAVEMEEKQHPDRETVPAALLYYHLDEPFAEGCGSLGEEEIDEKIRQALVPAGIVNGDDGTAVLLDETGEGRSAAVPVEWKKDGSFSGRSSVYSRQDMQLLFDYGRQKSRELGRRILEGDISLRPYRDPGGKADACAYCDYRRACGFDEKIPGCEARAVTDEDREALLEEMRQEVRAHGGAVHEGTAESH